MRHGKWLVAAALCVVFSMAAVFWQPWTSRPPVAMAINPRASKDNQDLLARLVCGEARGEPFQGKVAVAAVILNRTFDPRFPKTVAGVVYQPLAFSSVANGQIWLPMSPDCPRAAALALRGYDPTNNCVFFFNPAKTRNKYIWSRKQVLTIGQHIFAK